MEPGLDTGPVLLEKRVTIGPEETAGTLTERLATEGSMAIVQVLANLETLEAKEQSEDGVTYAAKITKSESLIDWRSPADHVSRQVRAFNPSPGAFTHWAGEPLKVWEAFVVDGVSASPGAFVGTRDGFPIVACREGGLALTLVQPAGSKRMTGADFLKGRPVPLGSFLS